MEDKIYNRYKNQINSICEDEKVYANRRREVKESVSFFDETDESKIILGLIQKMNWFYQLLNEAIKREDYELSNQIKKAIKITLTEFNYLFRFSNYWKYISSSDYTNNLKRLFDLHNNLEFIPIINRDEDITDKYRKEKI